MNDHQNDAPAIDPDWVEQEISGIVTDLGLQFPSVDADAVAAHVRTAAANVIETARIPNYLPVLIRRRAVTALHDATLDRVAIPTE